MTPATHFPATAGILREGISPRVTGILFGTVGTREIETDLPILTEIDRAHLVMLVTSGILPAAAVSRVLSLIEELRRERFASLLGSSAPRGLFLLYEHLLIRRLGPECGGILQTARSRNDLKATSFKIRLRHVLASLFSRIVRLQSALLNRARRYCRVTMPLYTHYQPAVPITYGHYLLGAAASLQRDIDGLLACTTDLQTSPLGAGAGGGTTFPIDVVRTAALLGFDAVSCNSVDAVASRDLPLRVLSSLTSLGITLSRVSSDLLLWSTQEFAMLRLPDRLSGSSSLMPQKRNPFILEHVQARVSAPLAGFVAAATAMHAAPFTNSVAVGTEAVEHVWEPVTKMQEACELFSIVLRGAEPQPDAMAVRERTGCTTATEMANIAVREAGLSFRSAHERVGSAIRAGDFATLPEASAVIHNSEKGGGPGPASFAAAWIRLARHLDESVATAANLRRKWKQAAAELDDCTHAVLRGVSGLQDRVDAARHA